MEIALSRLGKDKEGYYVLDLKEKTVRSYVPYTPKEEIRLSSLPILMCKCTRAPIIE